MKLNAIIVDDESTSRKIIANYLAKYCKNVTVLGEAENINEAHELIKQHDLDIVFLDVEMPFGNAFDLLDKVGDERNFETIFVTAYDHYAINALNNNATYYLLKPISIDELINAVHTVTEIKEKELQLENEIIHPKLNTIDGKITLPQLDGFEILDVNTILYCKSDNNYTEIFTDKKKYLVSKTLKHFEDSLIQYNFVRVHKSYLINLNCVTKYKKGKGGSIVLSNLKEIMVSPSKKAELLAHFN